MPTPTPEPARQRHPSFTPLDPALGKPLVRRLRRLNGSVLRRQGRSPLRIVDGDRRG